VTTVRFAATVPLAERRLRHGPAFKDRGLAAIEFLLKLSRFYDRRREGFH
jgi:hypothetical protein